VIQPPERAPRDGAGIPVDVASATEDAVVVAGKQRAVVQGLSALAAFEKWRLQAEFGQIPQFDAGEDLGDGRWWTSFGQKQPAGEQFEQTRIRPSGEERRIEDLGEVARGGVPNWLPEATVFPQQSHSVQDREVAAGNLDLQEIEKVDPTEALAAGSVRTLAERDEFPVLRGDERDESARLAEIRTLPDDAAQCSPSRHCFPWSRS